MENKNLTTLTLENDNRASDRLRNMPRWVEARNRLLGILDAAEDGSISEFFGCKVAKGAPFSYQVLANLTFTSAGYVGDKWKKYENETLKNGNRPSVYEFLCKNLVPLTAEELAALAEKQKHEAEVSAKAQAYIESCELMDIKITAENVQNNAKLLSKFGEEVVAKITELLSKSAEG